MADKFVLRWEFNNMGALYAAGKAESQVFNEGGFKWTAVMRLSDIPEENDGTFRRMTTTLTCDYVGRGDWSCEANVKLTEYYRKLADCVFKRKMSFDNDNRVCEIANYEILMDILNPTHYFYASTAVFEFRIKILSSKFPPVIDLTQFCPNGMGNVTLVFGDKKLQVSKEYLAVHPPVFAAMFFGDFAEKGKEEVEINDVVYEEFVDLLQFIYLRSLEISDRCVPFMLMLGDRFQMECVMNELEKHLTKSTGFDVTDKLQLAGQYRLAALKDHCYELLKNEHSLAQKVKSSPEFDKFSADVRAAIESIGIPDSEEDNEEESRDDN